MNLAPSTSQRPATATALGGWLHLCNGLDPARDGGMVPSILGMTGALARLDGGRDLAIVTPTPSRLGAIPVPPGVDLRGPETDLPAAVRSAGVVHLHGLWQGHSRRGARVARKADIPYVVAAHGMADPWALRHKALKKRVYAALVEGPNLRRASCLHALSRPEVGHLRALAPDSTTCLVPNGVDLVPFDNLPGRAELQAEHPQLIGKFVLLFFGRLHAKKGLDLLAGAIAALADDHPDLHALVVGRDDGALGPFRAQLRALGIQGRATCLPHVGGEAARRVWGAADAFVLPSRSEGFSMAILEALACRLPVVATDACHFPELAEAGAGVVVPPDAAGVVGGLRAVLERSAAERVTMGRNGRELVERDFTWDRQAGRLAEVYRWVLGGGPTPRAVAEAREVADRIEREAGR